jgi:hypothetical protein
MVLFYPILSQTQPNFWKALIKTINPYCCLFLDSFETIRYMINSSQLGMVLPPPV